MNGLHKGCGEEWQSGDVAATFSYWIRFAHMWMTLSKFCNVLSTIRKPAYVATVFTAREAVELLNCEGEGCFVLLCLVKRTGSEPLVLLRPLFEVSEAEL
jgi:hypothetical protein